MESMRLVVDLIWSQYRRELHHSSGVTVNGVSTIEFDRSGTPYRWFEGPQTVLAFKVPEGHDLTLVLDFVSTLPGQNMSILANGRTLEAFGQIPEGTRTTRRYKFASQGLNQVLLQYSKTNGALSWYPSDTRDLAAFFYEFKVLEGDNGARTERWVERAELASVTHLGAPLLNAELNRREYEEGQTVLKSLPSVVTLALTTYCNNRAPCLICDRNTRTREAECDISAAILEHTEPLLKTAMTLLLHCGGEAMLSRHYDQVIDSIQPPTRATFATNAMLMNRQRADRMLKKDIMAGIVVSLDAATPEMYRIMRPGSKFETVIENVAYYIARTQELGRVHSNVTLNMTLCEANLADAPKLVELAAQIGAYGVDFNHLNVGPDHVVRTTAGWDWSYVEQASFRDKDHHDRVVLEACRLAAERGIFISMVGTPFIGPNAEKHAETARELTRRVAFQEGEEGGHWVSPHHKRLAPNLPCCFKPWQETVIQPEGLVRVCYFHDVNAWAVGDLARSEFMSIWNSEQMIATRERFLARGVARACVESQPCMHRGRE